MLLIPEIENVSGLFCEIKGANGSDYPVLECFRNMSDVAAALTLQGLNQGIVVHKMPIYEIVAEVLNMDKARLLKLKIDFKTNTSSFLKSFGTCQFDLLLNAVVSILAWVLYFC